MLRKGIGLIGNVRAACPSDTIWYRPNTCSRRSGAAGPVARLIALPETLSIVDHVWIFALRETNNNTLGDATDLRLEQRRMLSIDEEVASTSTTVEAAQVNQDGLVVQPRCLKYVATEHPMTGQLIARRMRRADGTVSGGMFAFHKR